MNDIRKLIDMLNETTTAGAVSTVAQPMTTERRGDYTAENTEESAKPQVLEYGNWENSALATGKKLKSARKKASKIVKSVYGESTDSEVASDKKIVAEGYILKKTNVNKYVEPGDPEDYRDDVKVKDTDYEIINNKTGQVVGTASWTTNDYFGPGALKITMKNGATRWLDIWEREKGNPQTAFNRFVKDPKTAKKYKEQGVAEGSEEQGAHVKYFQGYNDAKNSKPSTHKTLTGNDRHNYVMGYKDGLTDRKKPKQQGVAEGLRFSSGAYPDVDHMSGSRGINLPSRDTRDLLQKDYEYYGNKQKWDRDVQRVNSELLDKEAEFISRPGGTLVQHNGKRIAVWSARNGNGDIDIAAARRSKKSKNVVWTTDEQGVAEGSIKDAETALAKHGQYKVDYEKKYGPMSGADLHQHEVIRKQLLDKKRRAQSAYAKKQGVAEGSEQKFKVTYDIYGGNREKPLYTNSKIVRANSEQEAINILRKLVGGTNYRAEKYGVAESADESMKLKAESGDVKVFFGPVDSEGAIVSVRRNGKEIASGDYDRHAGKIWIGHSAYDSSAELAAHYAEQD